MSDQKRCGAPKAGASTPHPGPSRFRGVRRVARAVFLVAALGACGWLVWRTRDEFWVALSDVSASALAGAFAIVLVGSVVPMLAWRVVLRDAGSPVPIGAAARIYFIAQLGKFIPGSVWSLLAQVELSREHDVPVRRAGAVALLNLVIAAVCAVVVIAVTLPFSTETLRRDYWWVVLLLPPLIAFIHPTVIAWWTRLVFRLLRREPEPVRLSTRAIATAIGWMLLAWVCYGLQIYVLVLEVGDTGAAGLGLALQCIGVFALAWIVGLLFVIAPAGAGIRELIVVVGLGSVLPPGRALAVALISRLLLTFADLLLAGVAAASYRLRQVRSGAPSPNSVPVDRPVAGDDHDVDRG